MTSGSIRLQQALVQGLGAAVVLAVLAGISAGGALAQATAEQQGAIKASCRSDFMAKCSDVTPGGKDALTCLQRNVSTLSPACQSAVTATLPPPAAVKPAAAAVAKPAPVAAATPTAAQQSAMKASCRSDFMAKCSGVSPGGKDAFACLQRNVGTLSPACKQAVASTMPASPAAAVAGAPPPAAAAVAVPAGGPTPQQMSAVKFTCRTDFKRYCGGIQPGGPEAIGCLQRNGARLAQGCKTSLADIADSLPAAPVAATAAATPVVVAPAPRRLPAVTPAGRVMRRVIERNR